MDNKIVPNKSISKDDIKEFVLRWNATYPVDRWWREKHKVAFNSPAHRVVSFLDMYIEWTEDQLIKDLVDKDLKRQSYKQGHWLTPKEIDLQEEIRMFENIDLSKFDDKDKTL